MNYVELHIGDYEKATSHLTACEDGIYGRLIRRYYDTESPLPLDIKALQRFVRARARDERDAVETVLVEFFIKADDGWHHKRCDEEIAKYKAEEPERQAKKENAKERQQRARARRADLFALLRSHDVVPPYDIATSELVALASRVTSQPVTPPVTRDSTATQTPDTSNQQKSDRDNATPVGLAAIAMRQAGCSSLNQSHPDFLAALDEGVTPKEFADATEEAKGRGISGAGLFTYAIGIARTNHAKTANQITGATHGNAASTRGGKLSAVEQVRAANEAAEQREAAAGDIRVIG